MNLIAPKTALYVILSFLPFLPAANCAQHGRRVAATLPAEQEKVKGKDVTICATLIEANVSDIFRKPSDALQPDSSTIDIERIFKALDNEKASIAAMTTVAGNWSGDISGHTEYQDKREVLKIIRKKGDLVEAKDTVWRPSHSQLRAALVIIDGSFIDIEYSFNYEGAIDENANSGSQIVDIQLNGGKTLQPGKCEVAAYTIRGDKVILLTLFAKMEN